MHCFKPDLGAIVYDDTTLFPGVSALLPAMSTAILLCANSQRTTAVGRLLSLRPLVVLGRQSYSLYLWHWPVLSYAFLARGSRSGTFGTWCLVGLSYFLAFISYQMVEKPFREGTIARTDRELLFVHFTWSIALATLCLWTIGENGHPDRFPPAIRSALTHVQGVPDRFARNVGPEDVRDGKVIRLGRGDKEASVLIWGDSHARVLLPAFDQALRELELSGVGVAYAASPPFADRGTFARAAVSSFALSPTRQIEWGRACVDYVKSHHVSKIFLVARWTYYGKEVAPRLRDTIDALNRESAEVWVVSDVPFIGDEAPRLVGSRALLKLSNEEVGITRATYASRCESVRRALAEPAHGAVHLLMTDGPFLGRNGRYRVFGDDGLYYTDGDHLSRVGALRLVPDLRDALRSPQSIPREKQSSAADHQ